MKWLFLMVVPFLVNGCSNNCPGDCNDGGVKLVSSGQTCTTEGATALGDAPVCSDIGGGTTTCTCASGKWDCGKCPACGTIALGTPCGIGEVCSGPTTAKQCDGTTTAATGDCHCDSTGWACDGVTAITCGDAGADAPTD